MAKEPVEEGKFIDKDAPPNAKRSTSPRGGKRHGGGKGGRAVKRSGRK